MIIFRGNSPEGLFRNFHCVPSLINPYINKLACGSVVIFEWGLRVLLTKDRCLHVQVLELNTSSPKEQLCNCPISELSPQAQINDGRAIKIGSRVRCASDYPKNPK
jgi:hypothetical protein